MIDAKDTAGALYGLWRLARGDASGLDFFNATLEGFWRSFAAAVIIAPPASDLSVFDLSQDGRTAPSVSGHCH